MRLTPSDVARREAHDYLMLSDIDVNIIEHQIVVRLTYITPNQAHGEHELQPQTQTPYTLNNKELVDLHREKFELCPQTQKLWEQP